MKRNLFVKVGDIISITIKEYAFGGKGIGKIKNEHGEFVVFVLNTLPGQEVKVKIKKINKRYCEAILMEVLSPSPQEVKQNFQQIPGAPYINLPIDLQHEYKKKSTFELFKKIAKIENIESLFDEFIPSPQTFHYRNKMEYSFSSIRYDYDQKKTVDEFSLGFKKRGTWWCVENVDKDSGIFDKEIEDHLKKIRFFLEKTGLDAWHAPKKKGFFRYFIVRKSDINDEILCKLVTTSEGISTFDVNQFSLFLKELFKNRIIGFIHAIHDEIGDSSSNLNGTERLILGKEKIMENLLGLEFEISMKSFFQTNTKSAEKLYEKVISYTLKKNDTHTIMDLFCGTGTIAQILANKGKNTRIIGVDITGEAIEDAKKNAKKNNIKNANFYTADVGSFLKEHTDLNQIETVILDPPRAGISPKTLKKIIALETKKIIYVSCNPATQARDTAILIDNHYKLSKLSMIDQFPHTAHIETIAMFEKINPPVSFQNADNPSNYSSLHPKSIPS